MICWKNELDQWAVRWCERQAGSSVIVYEPVCFGQYGWDAYRAKRELQVDKSIVSTAN